MIFKMKNLKKILSAGISGLALILTLGCGSRLPGPGGREKPTNTIVRTGIDFYAADNASPNDYLNGEFKHYPTWARDSLAAIVPSGMHFVQPWFQVYTPKCDGYCDMDNIEVKINGAPVAWEGYKCETTEGWMIERWHDNDPWYAPDDGKHECIYPAEGYLSIVPGLEGNAIRVTPDSAEWSKALFRYTKVPVNESNKVKVSIYYKTSK